MPFTKLSFVLAAILSTYLAVGSAAKFMDKIEDQPKAMHQ